MVNDRREEDNRMDEHLTSLLMERIEPHARGRRQEMLESNRNELLTSLLMELEWNGAPAQRSRQGMLESNRNYQENLPKRVVPTMVAREQQIMQDVKLAWALFDEDVPMELDVTMKEHCLICLESIFPIDMVCQKGCEHRFCFNCLSQHVQNDISAGKVPVRCPQFSHCTRHMDDNECQSLVSHQLFDSNYTRLMEASIPDSEKVYCPFPACSAMMSKTRGSKETDIHAASSSSSTPRRSNDPSAAECVKCNRLFCVECLVPWHANLSCVQYQALPPNERDAEVVKLLLQLAEAKKWRKCGQCNSLIMLACGCVHITCSNEFCYACGSNYEGKLQLCSCPPF